MSKFTPTEKIDYLNRVINRANKSAGYNTAKKPSIWGFEFLVNDIPACGMVEAHTKGEARAMVKKRLGIGRNSRLPSYIKVEKIDA